MPKLADNISRCKGLMWAIAALSLFFFSACSTEHKSEVDRLNEQSYSLHYRNLDSTEHYAKRALMLSSDYADGQAEAYNNLAFVCMGRMNYVHARKLLDSVALVTDNQVELFVADIQGMRLCQRQSRNKEFYDYNERARLRLKRIEEERHALSAHLERRYIYAKSEFAIVRSTYYYYVGLQKQSAAALESLSLPELQKDTAQYLNYLYQVGSGGIVTGKTDYETCQSEFEKLLECYLLAQRNGYTYWKANSLQALGEHLTDNEQRLWLTTDNAIALQYLNQDNMPDSLIAGYLSQKALQLFMAYGDKYQIAGAYRTLASCYWALGDYTSSLICLNNALADKQIEQSPDLVASIREQLSLTYSALDDKTSSDRNRNLYLDMQEKTRQDRELEARAEQLKRTSTQLDILAGFILFLLIIVVALIVILRYMRRDKDRSGYTERLLQPLRQWEKQKEQDFKLLTEKQEELTEALSVSRLHVEQEKRINAENRAKIFLANSVTPYVDRIIHEAERLQAPDEPQKRKRERMQYITELTEKIAECNTVLTFWIQLRQGELGVKIESFPLQSVFDIVSGASTAFRLKGVRLNIAPTPAVVKADRTLTLFMLNTLADNARKFTGKDGAVSITATAENDYVEVSVEDTGCGLSQQELETVFTRTTNGRHGFGLQNCRGIIERYKKISRVFNVCTLAADSRKGVGSRFYFRLPHGVMRLSLPLLLSIGIHATAQKAGTTTTAARLLHDAGALADSAYYSNVNGRYDATFRHVQATINALNKHHQAQGQTAGRFMSFRDDGNDSPAEVEWFRAGVKTDYNIILDIRNEAAVAALALHDWDAYTYNNKVYTQLFKLKSADAGLAEYCRTMQRSSANTAIAVAVLVLLLIAAVVSFYLLYYRHVLFFRFCADGVDRLNATLLDMTDDAEKLRTVSEADTRKYPKQLRLIVETIRAALQQAVSERNRLQTETELAEDELRRSDFEHARLYVCDNVTANCLSALKHETMYYPNRISLLAAAVDCDAKALAELARYYRELCATFARQAADIATDVRPECRAVPLRLSDGSSVTLTGDSVLVRHLLDILKKENGGTPPPLRLEKRGGRSVTITALCANARRDGDGKPDLFTPSVENIPFLICRQILRDMGAQTNLHATGMTAERAGQGLLLRLTMPEA